MQEVSSAFRLLWSESHYVESKVVINGTTYGEDKIVSMSIYRSLYKNRRPIVGSCISAEISLVLLYSDEDETIPTMALIEPYIRLSSDDGTRKSEWVKKGEFYIDTRRKNINSGGEDTLTIHGFDAMLKTDVKFVDETVDIPASWVYLDVYEKLGIPLDDAFVYTYGARARTITFTVEEVKGRTVRELLGYLALMLGGNFIIDEVTWESQKMWGLKFIPFKQTTTTTLTNNNTDNNTEGDTHDV